MPRPDSHALSRRSAMLLVLGLSVSLTSIISAGLPPDLDAVVDVTSLAIRDDGVRL